MRAGTGGCLCDACGWEGARESMSGWAWHGLTWSIFPNTPIAAKLPGTSKQDPISKINCSSWVFTKFSLSECSRTGGAQGEATPLILCFSRFPLWSCCVTQPPGSYKPQRAGLCGLNPRENASLKFFLYLPNLSKSLPNTKLQRAFFFTFPLISPSSLLPPSLSAAAVGLGCPRSECQRSHAALRGLGDEGLNEGWVFLHAASWQHIRI